MSTIILFDAVGTLLKTTPGVIEVYHRHGLRHGSSLSAAEINVRFKVARRRLFDLDTSAKLQTAGQLVSSDSIERALWFQLIADIFSDVVNPTALFEELWQFFASPDNWQLFDDVAATFQSLKSAGYLIAIASNFDSRLNGIVSAFGELNCADFVFCSAGVGFRKPDPAFYQTVAQRIEISLSRPIREPVYFVGDCIENDCHGPTRFGWNGTWLNRSDKPTEALHDTHVVRSLTHLAERVIESSTQGNSQ